MRISPTIIKLLSFIFLALIAFFSLNDSNSTAKGVPVIESIKD